MSWWIEHLISHWQAFAWALGYLAGAWVVARFLRWPMGRFLEGLAGRSKSTLDDRMVAGANRPMGWVIVAIGLKLAHESLRDNVPDIAAQTAYQWLEHPIIPILTVFSFAFLIDRIVHALLDWYIHEMAGGSESRWDDQVLPMIKRVATLVIGFVALSMILKEFGLDITALVTTAGVASFAVAFASQETLSNMIAGFTIMVDQPFKVGDLVELSDGKIGEVVDIGLRSTKIKQFDGNALVVPNKDIAGARLTNFSLPNPMRAIREEIGVAYGTDINRAKEIVLECLKAQPEILADPEPICVFIGFGPSELKLFAIGWVDHYSKWFPNKEKFLLAVLDRFREEGIQIPFPQRDVHLFYENLPPKGE